ncbi:hypothetical protein BLNAU_7354 [Blattamonas nauphoetae]|uniref:Protein kinase domain-containing protein n=1 Tax=Blattamonas nauphoetae TaxID=2049346 RepID=A0ABQ9Y207_9EUKA|nr:hypothetical protein BLNAU_7354 [Blattamonas nauphoetae]
MSSSREATLASLDFKVLNQQDIERTDFSVVRVTDGTPGRATVVPRNQISSSKFAATNLIIDTEPLCPYILKFYEHKTTDDNQEYIFVHEDILTPNLGTILENNSESLSHDEAAILTTQLLHAIDAAYQLGLSHRQLSLDHFFLKKIDSGNYILKVNGFRPNNHKTNKQDTIACEKEDVFSVGRIFHEFLLGIDPFNGKKLQELRTAKPPISFSNKTDLSREENDTLATLLNLHKRARPVAADALKLPLFSRFIKQGFDSSGISSNTVDKLLKGMNKQTPPQPLHTPETFRNTPINISSPHHQTGIILQTNIFQHTQQSLPSDSEKEQDGSQQVPIFVGTADIYAHLPVKAILGGVDIETPAKKTKQPRGKSPTKKQKKQSNPKKSHKKRHSPSSDGSTETSDPSDDSTSPSSASRHHRKNKGKHKKHTKRRTPSPSSTYSTTESSETSSPSRKQRKSRGRKKNKQFSLSDPPSTETESPSTETESPSTDSSIPRKKSHRKTKRKTGKKHRSVQESPSDTARIDTSNSESLSKGSNGFSFSGDTSGEGGSSEEMGRGRKDFKATRRMRKKKILVKDNVFIIPLKHFSILDLSPVGSLPDNLVVSAEQHRNKLILIHPVLSHGSWRLEVSANNLDGLSAIGVSVPLTEKAHPSYLGESNDSCRFDFFRGSCKHAGEVIKGNDTANDNDVIAAELSFSKTEGTLLFFVKDILQPVYFTSLPKNICFALSLTGKQESLHIRSFIKSSGQSYLPPDGTSFAW